MELPAGRYSCIVADPPWPYDTPGQIGQTLEHRPNRDSTLAVHGAGSVSRYGSMSIDEICDLNPPSARDAHLYLWFTNRFAVEAHAVARAWGFRPITICTWVKVKADGTPSMKMGRYFRGATEHFLFGVKGSLRLQTNKAYPTAFLWPRPGGIGHSRKPDEFYDLVREVSPGPRIDLFNRRLIEGFDGWGDESPEAARKPVQPVPEGLEEEVEG